MKTDEDEGPVGFVIYELEALVARVSELPHSELQVVLARCFLEVAIATDALERALGDK